MFSPSAITDKGIPVCALTIRLFGTFEARRNGEALPGMRLRFGESLLAYLALHQGQALRATSLAQTFWTEQAVAEGEIEKALASLRQSVRQLRHTLGDEGSRISEVDRYYALVGGHPFLVRRGLYEMTTRSLSIEAFETQAENDEGLFGDHLRRILTLLARDPDLREVVRASLRGQASPSPENFHRLRSAGIVIGDAPTDMHPRCRLYTRYLTKHIL